jgi:hypothetical protein
MTLRLNENYIVNVKTSSSKEQGEDRHAKVFVMFHEEASTRDLLLGISHGHVIRYLLAQQGYVFSETKNAQHHWKMMNRLDIIEQSHELITPKKSGSAGKTTAIHFLL